MDNEKTSADITKAVTAFAEDLKAYIIKNWCVTDDDVDKIWKKINQLANTYTEQNKNKEGE